MLTVINHSVQTQNVNNTEGLEISKFPMKIDEKIHNNVAMPAFEEEVKQSNPAPESLENRVELNVSSSKPLIDRINEELELMDALLLDPHADSILVLQQAYRIIALLQVHAAQTQKKAVLDKEPELWEDVQKLKGSFNTWGVLISTIVTGGLTLGGSFSTLASALPGTTLGVNLATSLPQAFQFFGNANNAKILATAGEGIKGVGQGTDSVQKLFGNSNDAKRAVLNYLIENNKRKQSDSQDSYRQARNSVDGANSNCLSALEKFHRAFESILKGAA